MHGCGQAGRNKRETGFTLYELLITLAIAGIVLTAGIPSLGRFVAHSRLHSSIDELYMDLQIARSEAIKRGEHVLICRTGGGRACTAGRPWREGWMVFADDNASGYREAGEALIRRRLPIAPTINLEYHSLNPDRLTFKADGSATFSSSFVFCDAHGNVAPERLVVFYTGRIRVTDKNSANKTPACAG